MVVAAVAQRRGSGFLNRRMRVRVPSVARMVMRVWCSGSKVVSKATGRGSIPFTRASSPKLNG